MKKKSKIVPVILGQDLGAYSVAKAFYEAYGVKSYAFGRYRCGISDFSRIIKIEFCSGYERCDLLLPELISFAAKKGTCELVLIPASDSYVEFAAKNREILSRYYKFLIPSDEHIKKLTDKAMFYRELSRVGIDFPQFTELCEGDNYLKKLSHFEYPAVLKPSKSAEYWRHPFPDMRKIYYPSDKDEAGSIVAALRYYGYREGIILQELIENAEIYVYTALFDKNGKCDFGVFGKVVLEEKGKTSWGNHSAIISKERCDFTNKLDKLLENLGYVGFANFDILKSGDKFYVLELNARQGRSCDYIRSSGVNIAKRLLRVLGLSKDESLPSYRETLWHYPPLKTALKYMSPRDREDALRLKEKKKSDSAIFYKKDLLFNFPRASYVVFHGGRVKRKFKKDFSWDGK
jgi:D-aspartate ligase